MKIIVLLFAFGATVRNFADDMKKLQERFIEDDQTFKKNPLSEG